jgi:tetratricopeptide (TPR) repeat protein
MIEPQNTQANDRVSVQATGGGPNRVDVQAAGRANDLEALRRAEAAGAKVMAARNALRKGERNSAKELIKEAFAANPGDIAAIELLGDMFLEEGETEKALGLFERAHQQHPEHIAFEEKLAICRLDLAEMESDRLARQLLLEQGDLGKGDERSSTKAMTLSLLLPGAGQFYNDENEIGTVYMGAGLLSFLAWVQPLLTALSKQKFNFGNALSSMSGLQAPSFYLGIAIWTVVYVASVVAAGNSAKRYNEQRRGILGL